MAVKIEFIASSVLSGKTAGEKIHFILSNVKEGKIVVLEEPLTPQEEKQLISRTMARVTKNFPGIEVSSLGEPTATDLRARIIRLLGGKTSGLTVVGPSNLVKQVKRDPEKLRLWAGA